MLLVAAGVAAVAFWWLRIPPSNDRDWQPDVARPATARFDNSRVTIENVRNFAYRSETDSDEIWETRTYDLDRLTGVDLFLSFWGPTLIAHTIVSWEFEDAPPLAISIETRKEKGEAYSAVLGFFRQYELYYVVADERDVVGLRTNHRGEHTYLYRVRMSPEQAREVLVNYLETVERLAHQPDWYNAFTHNCTTTIRMHLQHVGLARALNWRLFANGKLDELMYQRGTIDTSLPFAELRARSEITEKAKAAGSAADFSRRIREGLPGLGARRAAIRGGTGRSRLPGRADLQAQGLGVRRDDRVADLHALEVAPVADREDAGVARGAAQRGRAGLGVDGLDREHGHDLAHEAARRLVARRGRRVHLEDRHPRGALFGGGLAHLEHDRLRQLAHQLVADAHLRQVLHGLVGVEDRLLAGGVR